MENIIKKLGYKGESGVLVINAPQSFKDGAFSLFNDVSEEADGKMPFIMVFCENRKEFDVYREKAVSAYTEGGRFFVCYPKKTSKNYRSDLTRNNLWPLLGDDGFEPVSQFSIDDDWSAIRFRKAEEIKTMTRSRAVSETGKKKLLEKK